MIHRRHRGFRHLHHLRHLESPARRLRRHLAWGGILVAAGVAVLLQHQGLISSREAWLAAPAALAWTAFVRLAVDRDAVAVVRATVRLAIAAWLVVAIEQVGGWTFATTWPILLIGIGVAMLAGAIWPRRRCDGGAWEEPSW